MDGGSSGLPLSPPPPQVYLRRPMPPPDPAPPPKVHFFRPPAPIPIFTARGPGPRAASNKTPMPPPPAPAAAQAPPRSQPPPLAPVANQKPPPAAGAMRPPRPPSGAGSMLPPPAPQAVAKGQQRATPPISYLMPICYRFTFNCLALFFCSGDAGPLYSSNSCRYDSSLSLLTKKFISLLEGAEDGTLDLNKAAETLEKELESLYEEDDRLENEIRETQEKLEALALDEGKRKLMYVLKDDINKIHRFKGSTLIAINAPRGTSIEVPDPYADCYLFQNLGLMESHYKIVLRSSMGPIDCYLISDHKDTLKPSHPVMPDSSEPMVATGSAQTLQHMVCDPDQSVRQMDCEPSQAPKKGESNAACTNTASPSRIHETMTDILRIVPSDGDADADYWFASDLDVSVTDTWGT
ncbi:hypothetical protein PR202_gb27380 [Eleusine coracana subsp. coracana]|uniref:E2F/DP family winged-helix DNA-binding domain-containing protein n=1 Tax=Eleusine coracana subsp. coracana TaxID=191504 RepID=A0AAV5FUB9_ELECO|nr:hypothetical protein PR202_gb27380 [Eleusine coracana subsp. coracana]